MLKIKKVVPDRVKIKAKTPEEKEEAKKEAKKKADKERRDDEAESLAAKDKDVKAAEKELPERSEYSKERQDFIDNAPAEYQRVLHSKV
jgi:predicted lipid-binding transport protein (Tim44 family)